MTLNYFGKLLEPCLRECCYRKINYKIGEPEILDIKYQRLNSCSKNKCQCEKYDGTCRIYYQFNKPTMVAFRICEPSKLSKDESKYINNNFSSCCYFDKKFCQHKEFVCKNCNNNGEQKCPNCHGRIIVACRKCSGSGKISNDILDGSSMVIGTETNDCTTCNGVGQFNCHCQTGFVTCENCHGKLYYFVDISPSQCCIIS